MRKRIIILAALIISCAGMGNLYAYTYTYSNGTNYLINVNVQFYDDPERTGQIEVNKSFAISTKSLLKSWTAEAFVEDRWQQILNLTCDFLPGDHTFSILVNEVKDANGVARRSWNAINGRGILGRGAE